MHNKWYRAILVSLLMIFSSLAGCLEADNDESTTEEIGTIITSTYHVQQLVKAIVGDEITVELISTSNIPVHDYEPTANDIIRLQQSDIFFYHGLELEPWVDATLSGLGSDAPLSVQTHTLPSGEKLLDYESLLVADLCQTLDDTEFESVQLVNGHSAVMPEIYAEGVLHQLTFPAMDDDHDEDGHDEDGHDEDGHDEDEHDEDGHDEDGHDEDEHDEDGHDGHDDHDEHAHNEPVKVIQNPEGCTASDTVIAIFHLEEGVHHVEFMSENLTQFNMVTMKMNGGHAHHDHAGHGDEHGDEDGVCHDAATHENHDEYETEETCEAAGHMWVEEDGHETHHGDYCHDASTHENHDEYETEDACESAGHVWMEGDHDDSPTPEEALAMADANNDSQISWDEFWVSWNAEDDDHDDNDDHTGHGDEHGEDDHENHSALEEAMDDYMMGMLITAFNDSDVNNDTLLNIEELTTFILSIDAMDDTLNAFPTELLMSVFDEDQDGGLSLSEFMEMMEEMEEDDHDDHDEHDDHGDDDNGGMNETEMMELMFNMFDANTDGMISSAELEAMMDMGDDDDHDEHDDHGDKLVGHAMLNVLAEGDYGFAMPANIEFYIVMAEGGHDDHDDHSGHDDHDDHGDEDGDDHGDEGEHSDEEEGEDLSFDPHSWLDPVAFKEQVKLVLATLVAEYPSMDSKFTDNAEEFMATLDSLDEKFTSTFVTGTSCLTKKASANHNAYSYMAQRYGIEFVTVHGLDPEGEPTAADIIKVVDQINKNGITVLFIEEYTSPAAVQSIVEQTISETLPTGVTVKYLYTMEKAPKDSTDNYISLMEKNFDNLRSGLGCTA